MHFLKVLKKSSSNMERVMSLLTPGLSLQQLGVYVAVTKRIKVILSHASPTTLTDL